MASPQFHSQVYSRIEELDIYLFKEGVHYKLFEKLGSHLITVNGVAGTYFAVWAPSAERVSVIGDFNSWSKDANPLYVRWDSSGIWEGFIPGVLEGFIYKYSIKSKNQHKEVEKGDPFALYWETPPKTASVVWNRKYHWKDDKWMAHRHLKNSLSSPISIYEVHFGSWKRKEDHSSLTYREMAEQLPSYVKQLGFTHVEFMPLMEHPFYGSWGYQKTGYFAPSSRYGTPQDFMYLIEMLHQHEIGVYLDWVPSHFPSDVHGLATFDGTHLFEHEDPRQGFHPDWNSFVFNYSRHEVRSFLLSSAVFWLDKFHIDGLRVDAVSSMLYLDYSRKEGEWVPNIHGGHENLEAMEFLKKLNEYVYAEFPSVQMIAEESTAWPMVSRPTFLGGLGFGMKWNMGWMHDTLDYFQKDPIYRKYHHYHLLFNLYYFFNENFLLSLSHDEVVHGKGSLLGKMPGDDWQKFANLRVLISYMFAHPGKKLLFMGAEIAQWSEWNHESSLDWHLLQYEPHKGVQRLIQDLNHIYQREKALYEQELKPEGFEWVSMYDSDQSIIAFLRKGSSFQDQVLVVCNFTPIPRHNYALSINRPGKWKEIFNSDAGLYGGSNLLTQEEVTTESQNSSENLAQLTLQLPPLSILMFKYIFEED